MDDADRGPSPISDWPLSSVIGLEVSQASILSRLLALARRNPRTIVGTGNPLYAGPFVSASPEYSPLCEAEGGKEFSRF